MLLIGTLSLVTGAARLAAHLQTEWLWYHEVGQERVFWTMLMSRWIGGAAVALATAALLLVNFWLVDRGAAAVPRALAPSRRARRALRAGYVALAIAAGLVAGSVAGLRDWQQLLLWTHPTRFGVADPVFHRDVGFFVFELPVQQHVATWLLGIGVVALATALAGHIATGAIRSGRPLSATPRARTHLLALGALLLLVVAWRHRLAQFGLELPREGDAVPGGYTDLHVQLAWMRILVLIAFAAACALLFTAYRPTRVVPVVALVLVALAELAGPGPVTTVVQRYFVDPQTLSRERPYIAREIRFTQLAYGLRDVAHRALPQDAAISRDELREQRNVLDNVQLWDPDVLRADIDEHQSIGSFYSFPNVTIDRYREPTGARTMLLAERQLDLRRLEPDGRTWANDRLAYTHGTGLVAVPAGSVDTDGRPTFANEGFDPGTAATRVGQPRLYFGVQPPGATPWVIADSQRSEIEKPIDGSTPDPDGHYDGSAGIPVAGPLRRAVLALRFGELNFLISRTVRDDSRVILHRDVRDRVRTLAPFLTWERKPDAVVVGGRVQYLLTGYTATRWFPYARRTDLAGKAINYLRAAALATVDAYTGKIIIYATGGDPILRAWQRVFPTLFTPEARMPAGLRAHQRYPEDLFKIQSGIWATYHAGDVEDFYTRVDDWQEPADLSGPLDRVGSIRFRPRAARTAQQDDNQDDILRAPRMRPAYLLGRLPGDRRERFLLTTPFTPQSQENMTGYLAGYVDDRGRPRLTQLTLPRSRLTLGPAQVTRRVLATPAVGDRLRLLNAETTDLGARAVEAVRLSAPRVIPIGDAFLNVQAIYVTASGDGVTRLRLVTVYLNGHVGWGRDLTEALARARKAAAAAAAAAPRAAPATRAPATGSPTARR